MLLSTTFALTVPGSTINGLGEGDTEPVVDDDEVVLPDTEAEAVDDAELEGIDDGVGDPVTVPVLEWDEV